MSKEWIGVDFDGTLVSSVTGAPIQKMIDRVRGWLRQGLTVKIVTARVGHGDRSDVPSIDAFSKMYFGRMLEVTAEKDHNMVELWDDKAVQVIPNTGERADGRMS